MKRIAIFLCFFLIFHALIHAKEALLSIKKIDDTWVPGKLFELGDKDLVLLTVNRIKVTVQIKDIVSFSYSIKKGKPWGKVLLGTAIGGTVGYLSGASHGGQEKPTYKLVYSISGVLLGTTLGFLFSKSEKKTGHVFLKGLSHSQKLMKLRKFKKYALVSH